MLVVQKIEIPQKLKDELIKNNLPIPNYKDFCISYDTIENDTYNIVAEDSEIYETDIIKEIKNTRLTDTFQELLFRFIDKSGLKDSEIYNKANIDRRLFSKIRSDKNYHPSFGTVTLLALALNLSTAEFEQLLNSAFYSLPTNTYSGITLKYCFDNKLYNFYDVNNLIYTLTDKEIKDL